jgi:pilus assembly protein CpaF
LKRGVNRTASRLSVTGPRIILGEIRGGEAFDLLQLLNTGRSGTISTVHANSAAQGISRFTICVLQSGIEIPYTAIKANITESLNVLVQLERCPGLRMVSEASQSLDSTRSARHMNYNRIYSRNHN